MMWGSGYSNGPGWGLWMVLGWLSMVAFWGAVILGLVLLVRSLTGKSTRTEDSALDILRRRYAVGEITREQFESMRADLERSEPARR
ncbi:MAG: SHOCT domain-containing protein [Chloroflexi bacterium]|nr:SHOCT domain-containing protein [Chloroflexota bacterium]